MPATPEARARTGALARVIGPFVAIVPTIVAARAPNTATTVAAFFENADGSSDHPIIRRA